MPDITWSNVLDVAPELSTVPVALQTVFLGLVNTELSAAAFGGANSNAFYLARCYLAAHYGSTIGANNDSEVESETMGGLTRTYFNDKATRAFDQDDELRSTHYGRQYLQIARSYVYRGPQVCS